MQTLIEELQEEAADAFLHMQRSARDARAAHARSELLRHMLTTAGKVAGRSRPEAVEQVVREWMAAWSLDRAAWPDLAAEMATYTDAVIAFVAMPGAPTDAVLRRAAEQLEEAFGRTGATLPDQMAWRSECAHGWWEQVAPTPSDLPGRKDRPGVPSPRPGRPFWDAACAEHCRPAPPESA